MSIAGKDKTIAVTKPNGWSQQPNNPQDLSDVVENKPVITQVSTRRSVVDSEYMPTSHLIIHSSGDKWRVDYYRRLAGLDDVLQPLSSGMSATEQQYELIKDAYLHVESPLTTSQDNTTKEFSVTGEGSLTHGITPNYGDMFVADIGNGSMGLFTITTSLLTSYSKGAAYTLEWVLVDDISNGTYQEQLDQKTVRTLHYVEELVELYDSPFMTESAYATYVDLHEQDHRLIKNFQHRFWSSEVQSLRIPGQDLKGYDGWHAAFCRDIGLVNNRYPVQLYNLGRIKDSDITTLWRLFSDMDDYRFPLLHTAFCLHSVKSLPGKHVTRSVAWSPFDLALVPTGDVETADGVVSFYDDEMSFDIPPVSKMPVSLPTDLQKRFNLPPAPLFKNATISPYVLSQAFYDKDMDNVSILELMALRLIKGDVVPPEVVSVLASELFTENAISVYYYTPIILVLIHYCKRGS